jgi:hypothetical protein
MFSDTGAGQDPLVGFTNEDTADVVTGFPGDDTFTNTPGSFGLGYYAGSSTAHVYNTMVLFQVNNSAGDFLNAPAGWFLVSEGYFSTTRAVNTTLSVTYMGAVVAAPVDTLAPSPIVLSRMPAHLAHLPTRAAQSKSSFARRHPVPPSLDVHYPVTDDHFLVKSSRFVHPSVLEDAFPSDDE